MAREVAPSFPERQWATMTAMLSVLLIDNFDSFSFNLVDELEKRDAAVAVWRNDVPAERALDLCLALPAPRLLVLSPGPGAPRDAGCTLELVRLCAGRVPVFGVCLGHQAIVEAFGGEVGFAGEVVHGKPASITHDGTGIFEGLPSPMVAGRYHSLAARKVPPELRVTARTGDVVMAVEHRTDPVAGVQFHPESILTPHGGTLIESVIRWARIPLPPKGGGSVTGEPDG
jgi:anthranilate synthase component 2/anthranilate synthase/phosphoribosyltransferase